MGLEKIREEIINKAAEAEREIIAEANKKVAGIRKAAAEKMKQIGEEMSQSVRAEIEKIEKRETAVNNLIASKMIFEARKEVIDKVYSKAFERIRSMPKKEREQVIKRLLEKAKSEIDVGVVYANKVDREFIDKIGGNFEVKPLETEGGIVCETSDGKIRVDYTFAGIFNDLKEKTMEDSSKILFG